MSAFDSAVFWPVLSAAGMLLEASTVLPGEVRPKAFMVGFARPDVNPVTGAQSADYEIDYQYHDAPTLAEGAEVIVAGVLYRVREPPRVDIERGADGYWRCAYLTRVDECPT